MTTSSSRVHLDSSIVIALMDTEDAHHVAATEALVAVENSGGSVAISAAAYSEVLVTPASNSTKALNRAKGGIRELCGEPLALGSTIAEHAAKLRAQHQWLKTVDALIAATAQESGAKYLLTTDKRLARLPGVKLV